MSARDRREKPGKTKSSDRGGGRRGAKRGGEDKGGKSLGWGSSSTLPGRERTVITLRFE